MHLTRGAMLFFAALPFGCQKETAPTIEPDKSAAVASTSGSPSGSASMPSPSSLPSSIMPPPLGDCVAERFRAGEFDGAWMEGSSITYCVKVPDFLAGTSERACFAVDPSTGITRTMPSTRVAPTKVAPLATATFATSSPSGSRFELKGGLRTPKGAQVTWTDGKTKKVARAPLEYDEHVAFDGWLGDAVILRTWVDEGPGCGRSLYVPTKAWPLVLGDPTALSLGSCYDTLDLVFDTKSGKKALFDGDGGDLLLVDPATLAITRLDSKREVGGPGEFSTFTPVGEQVLVLFHAPVNGDFVRYDLTKEAIVGEGTPRVCAVANASAR